MTSTGVDHTGHDPCDQMVSLCQVIAYVAGPRTTRTPAWDLAGTILDCTRVEAKEAAYKYVYGGRT